MSDHTNIILSKFVFTVFIVFHKQRTEALKVLYVEEIQFQHPQGTCGINKNIQLYKVSAKVCEVWAIKVIDAGCFVLLSVSKNVVVLNTTVMCPFFSVFLSQSSFNKNNKNNNNSNDDDNNSNFAQAVQYVHFMQKYYTVYSVEYGNTYSIIFLKN